MAATSELGGLEPDELAARLALPKHLVAIEPIQKSATGALWRGRDRRVGRDIIIKVLTPECRDRLEAETRALGRLGDHPNVLSASIVGHGEDGTAWVVTEEMAETLADAATGASPADVLTWSAQLASALEHVHANDVIHGDVTPNNVLVGADGDARLADFGSARLSGDPQARVPGGHTPRYAAPERRRGVPATRASDVHGYGATVLSVIPGGADGAPRRVRRLLRRCVRVDPDKRPDMSAVVRVMVRR
ncbi:MAG: protein kinase domain-containing protein [Microthrixaceae bacterium]